MTYLIWQRAGTSETHFREEPENRCPLIHPGKGKWRKPRQMRLAQQLFKVPEWHLFQGELPHIDFERQWVVKSLTQTPIGASSVLFVRSVNPRQLDPKYPWFIQEKIDAQEEVTVVYIHGRIFAFSLQRNQFDVVDARLACVLQALVWTKTDLSIEEESRITRFMNQTGFDFGRFDFLRKDGELWFLELNPNGQWAWLDEDNQHGLFSAVADQLIKAVH